MNDIVDFTAERRKRGQKEPEEQPVARFWIYENGRRRIWVSNHAIQTNLGEYIRSILVHCEEAVTGLCERGEGTEVAPELDGDNVMQASPSRLVTAVAQVVAIARRLASIGGNHPDALEMRDALARLDAARRIGSSDT